MTAGIATGSAYKVAKLYGNSNGVPGIGDAEGESEGEVTRPLDPRVGLAVLVTGLAVGVGLGLELRLRFRVDEGSVGIVNPHLGKKHDVILTADASGRSRSRTPLPRVLFSVAAVAGGGNRIPGMKEVVGGRGGVIDRLFPALAGSELGPSPARLRSSSFLAIPLPRPKVGVRLLKTDPKRPFDLSLAAPWAGAIPRVNAASELEWWRR